MKKIKKSIVFQYMTSTLLHFFSNGRLPERQGVGLNFRAEEVDVVRFFAKLSMTLTEGENYADGHNNNFHEVSNLTTSRPDNLEY